MTPTFRRIIPVVFAVCALAVGACSKLKTASSPDTPPTDAEWKDGYKVLFVGDTDFGESYRKLDDDILKNGYDFGFEKVKPFLDAADLVIANLETPICDPATLESPFDGKKDYIHWAHVEKAPEYLKKYNIRTVNLANNHTLDYGIPGLKQTFETLAKNDMTGFGAGMTQAEAERPFETTFTLGERQVRLAVFGAFEHSLRYETMYSFYAKGDLPGAAMLDAERTSQLVREYRAANPDAFVIVYPHWGGNYAWKTRKQGPIAKAVLDAGADAVIGHGAHTLQQIERIAGKTVIHNVGNFVFTSPGRYRKYKVTPYGLAALVRFAPDKDGALRADARLYPIHTDNRVVKYQPRPLTDEEFAGLRTTLAEKSGEGFAKRVGTGKDALGNFFAVRLK